MSQGLTFKCSTQGCKPHAHMHHVVIIVSIIIIAMLTLCCSNNVTRYTGSLLSCIYDNIVDLLNIICTLVATCIIIGRLDVSQLLSE